MKNLGKTVRASTAPLRRAFGSRFFMGYLMVGAIVFVIDVGLFETFVVLHFSLWLGTAIAYVVGLVAHFLLNKYINFRAFDRTIFAQARTYLVLQIPMLLVTTVVVVGCTSAFHFAPLLSKAISIAINLPIGFLFHRYMTFSAGMRALVRRAFLRSVD